VEPWDVRDVSDWEVEAQEPRGKREKRWIRGEDGARWLRKRAHPARRAEPAIEAFALRLARATGLAAPESYPCQWNGEARGIIVRRFDLNAAESLFAGHEVIRGADPSFDPKAFPAHTVERAIAGLRRLEESRSTCLAADFLRILCFDAWIGNSDRHSENWSIVMGPDSCRVAPLYDPAGSLGAILQDDHHLLSDRRTEVDLERFVRRCGSGLGADLLRRANLTA
jgi:serine/threonine protein kinase HipA of HipAB toxin-antitoxin module